MIYSKLEEERFKSSEQHNLWGPSAGTEQIIAGNREMLWNQSHETYIDSLKVRRRNT